MATQRWTPVKIHFRAMPVCMECKREIVNGLPVGPKLDLAPRQSHGACLKCLPYIGRTYWGLKRAQIQVLVSNERARLGKVAA